MSDNGSENQDPVYDYEEFDEDGLFKKMDKQIYLEMVPSVEEHVKVQEGGEAPEPFDADGWAESHADEKQYDINRVKLIARFGIYGGERDEDMFRNGNGFTMYPNLDVYKGTFKTDKKQGLGSYIYKSRGSSETDKKIEEVKTTDEVISPFIQSAEFENDKQKRASLYHEAARHILDNTLWKIERTRQQMRKGIIIPEPILESVVLVLKYGPYSCYEGEFDENMKSGQGTFKYPDGSVYIGQWENNMRNGQGTLKFANGDIYTGSFVDGKRHGEGRYTYKAYRCTLEGRWEAGEIFEGQWQMPDGVFYKGNKSETLDKFPEDSHGEMWFPDLQQQDKESFVRGSFVNGLWRPDELKFEY